MFKNVPALLVSFITSSVSFHHILTRPCTRARHGCHLVPPPLRVASNVVNKMYAQQQPSHMIPWGRVRENGAGLEEENCTDLTGPPKGS